MKSNKPLTVTVIVPCLNEADFINAFLSNLLRQKLPPEIEWEVLIADGMSDDGTREILRGFCAQNPHIRTIDNTKRLIANGLNAAIVAARGDVIVRMDVHTTYADDYLEQCIKALETTGADTVGGPWVAVGRDYISHAVALAFKSSIAMGGGKAHKPDYTGSVDTVYLGCWRSQIFKKYGLFDEEQIRNEDEEFNVRIREGGGTIWQTPAIKSWYTPRSSLGSLLRQYMQYGYWKIRTMKKHRRILALRHLVPGAFVLSCSIALVLATFADLARPLLATISGAYLLFIVTGSISICGPARAWRSLPIIPVILAVMHIGYGCGTLRGIYDFLIAGHGAKESYKRLTR